MAKLSRRKFLGMTGATVAAAYLPWRFGAQRAMAFSQSPTTIPLFGTGLRGVGPGGIPVAAPDMMTDPNNPTGPMIQKPAPVTGVTHYTIDISKYEDQIVPPGAGLTALGPTVLFGYHPANPLGGGTQPQKHLGGIIVGRKNQPIQITFRNKLSTTSGKHIIPVDQTIPGAAVMTQPGYSNGSPFRTAVHFHGGLVPWISDGGPFDWFDPNGGRGASFLNNAVLNPANTKNGEAEYYYNLNQSARFGWYHDHAFGITRINAYAGIASGLIIRDSFEDGLIANAGVPPTIESSVLGGTPVRELPLVIQDKIFVGPTGPVGDLTWNQSVDGLATRPGSLWYAHVYEKNRWKLGTNIKGQLALTDPSVIPEFFGDTMLVNGTAYPAITVEPRRYRLRILNACNARFLNLQFLEADATLNGVTLNLKTGIPTNLAAKVDPTAPGVGANVMQIGTEGGFLSSPVLIPTGTPINAAVAPATGSLIVAPAERPDILIDFSKCANKSIVVYNDAPAPFPVGDPRNDYFPGWNTGANPVNLATQAGFGPNTRVLMRFNVGPTASSTDAPLGLVPTTLTTAGTDLSTGIDPLLLPTQAPWTGTATNPPAIPAASIRSLTLNEAFDLYGRLIQMLGTNQPVVKGGALGRAYTDLATETPARGTTEIWEIYNLTADVHPMHFHLVNVQILNRQAFSNFSGGTALFKGAPVLPSPNERGWKETVPMYPGTVTRIMMKFDLQAAAIVGNPVTDANNVTTNPIIDTTTSLIAGQQPITKGLPPVSPRTGGHEYVWHCHILEHEEHDMMRPLVVT